MSATSDERRALGELVYGVIDDGEPYLVFLERAEAVYLQEVHQALWTSKTWGEFRARVGDEEFAEVLEGFADAMTFEDFADEMRAEAEEEGRTVTDAEVDAAWAELPVGDRLPRDDDPFDASQVYAHREEGYPSSWPAQDMLDWVPADIRRRFGEIRGTMLDGQFLALDVRRERWLVRAFERAGWRCVRDDALVRRASGYGE